MATGITTVEKMMPVETTADPATTFRGGVNLDLQRRIYGIRRLRATYPSGHLSVDPGKVSLWASKRSLPPDLPLPVVLASDTTCVFVRRVTPGVGFKTSSTVHYFWTLRPTRIVRILEQAGFAVCP